MATWIADDKSAINYEVIGGAQSGKDTLVLLHGMLGTMKGEWQTMAKHLSADFRLVMLDLRGHGRSQNNESDLQADRLAQDVVGLLNHLKVEQFHISGYSLGGYLGLLLALALPRRVNSLMMHATKFYWTKETAVKMRQQLDPDKMAEKVPTYADQLVQAHGARHWRILVRQCADIINTFVDGGVTEGMVNRMQIPTLISIGDRDEMVPLPEAQRLSRVIPNGELLVLPRVKHPFNTIVPIPFVPAIQYFHKSNSPLR